MRSLEWQERKHAMGLCSSCGKRKPPINKKTGHAMWRCDICRAKWNIYQNKRYFLKKGNGNGKNQNEEV